MNVVVRMTLMLLLITVATPAVSQDERRISPAQPGPRGKFACTITVPVRLQRLSKEISEVRVACAVWDQASAAKSFDLNTALGFGTTTPLTLKKGSDGLGSFQSLISVNIFYGQNPNVPAIGRSQSNSAAGGAQNLARGRTTIATDWACDLIFATNGGSSRPKGPNASAPAALRAAPRTRFTPRVTGKVPAS